MKVPKYFYFRVKTVNHGTALALEDASDVDVVEVVRCKDCIYSGTPDENKWRLCHHDGAQWNEENHYCGYAERREVTT